MRYPKAPKEKLVSVRLTVAEWEAAHAVAAARGQSLAEWYRAQLRAAQQAEGARR